MKHGIRTVCFLVLTLTLLAACSNDAQKWKTTNITGVMPDLKFTLTNERGKTVHARAYRGKINLVYFGYTHCPDVCPLTLSTIGRALGKLGKKGNDFRVLFVSVDPERDTPGALRKYTDSFGSKFIGLTGSQKQLKDVSKRYRVSYSYGKPDAHGNYVVNHSSGIFVFAPDGRVRLLMKYTDGAKAMAHDLRQLDAS